jgi:DNA-binding transcriptional MerR regulator
MYSIKELADLAGTTTRTLRYYDQQGLLAPARIGKNGYRYYDRESLLTLQQILFYRELDVPLKEIGFYLSRPDFQILPSLKDHQQAIGKRISRYQKLLDTIQRTISDIEGEGKMNAKDLFNGFDEEAYQAEAQERWGNTAQYQQSQRNWTSYSEEKKAEIKDLGGEITRRMVSENPQAKPDDPEVQTAIQDYYQYLNQYFYSCEVEFLRNLADMWVEDPRFAVNYERIREGGAEFVREAVHYYCDQGAKKEIDSSGHEI